MPLWSGRFFSVSVGLEGILLVFFNIVEEYQIKSRSLRFVVAVGNHNCPIPRYGK